MRQICLSFANIVIVSSLHLGATRGSSWVYAVLCSMSPNLMQAAVEEATHFWVTPVFTQLFLMSTCITDSIDISIFMLLIAYTGLPNRFSSTVSFHCLHKYSKHVIMTQVVTNATVRYAICTKNHIVRTRPCSIKYQLNK